MVQRSAPTPLSAIAGEMRASLVQVKVLKLETPNRGAQRNSYWM
jgi:hypothetical protein